MSTRLPAAVSAVPARWANRGSRIGAVQPGIAVVTRAMVEFRTGETAAGRTGNTGQITFVDGVARE